MKADILQHQGDIKYEIDWTTLGEYLDSLVRRGISLNVASFVGATSVRVYVLGEDDVIRRLPSWPACRTWCDRRCGKARWASAVR